MILYRTSALSLIITLNRDRWILYSHSQQRQEKRADENTVPEISVVPLF